MFKSIIDLHLHTTASDGASSPLDMVRDAKDAGLSVISLTDHESLQGMDIASAAGDQDITLIPGVELVTWYSNREIHLLGYMFDVKNQQFRSWVKHLGECRNNTYLKIAANMNNLGFNIKESQLIDTIEAGGTLGKNHIILLLIEAGYITSKEQAFEILRKYLTPRGQAYVNFDTNPFFEAVSLIKEAGGIPVLAHPGLLWDDQLVLELLSQNNVGLEVYYYYFGPKRDDMINKYKQIAREKGIIATGGSDYHGAYSPDIKLGKAEVPNGIIEEMNGYLRG
ncbi:MAG: PHP domain-containing protein [Candidatus Saccharibacteria bacterium]